MKRTLCFLLLALVLSKTSFGQHEKIIDNWKTISVNDNNQGNVQCHVYKNKINEHKPLIVYLEGSKNFPLYYLKPDGRYSTSTTLDFRPISNDYHIVLISKPYTPFVHSIRIAPPGRKYYPLNEEYREKCSLNLRRKLVFWGYRLKS